MDPAIREASIAQTPEHLDPIRGGLGLGRDPEFELGLARMLTRPEWVRACVALHDAMALAEFVRGVRPGRVLEIGTCSGFSAATMLWAMEAGGGPRREDPSDARGAEAWLDSFDLFPACYFDQSHATGSAVLTMTPSLAHRLRLHVGDARSAAEVLGAERATFPLAFIDACHDHPWPTLDLLWIAPLLAPGAWVVLHDVAYARILDAKRAREGRPPKRSEYGPEALFEAWPGAKIIGDGWAGNIGAIRIDDPASVTPDLLRGSLERRWEKAVAPEFAGIAGRFAPA
jgi:predicted O-methyltransferase YrrM